MLNEMDSESQLEIVSEYPFANSALFYPKVFSNISLKSLTPFKVVYNGPIRLNELSDIHPQEELVEESPGREILKGYKIFQEESSLKVMYKLQVEGCILPLSLKVKNFFSLYADVLYRV